MHPTRTERAGQVHESPRHHQIALMVDDLATTMTELERRGAVFSSGPDDRGFGLVALLQVPGADELMMYQPRHAVAHSL